MNSVSLYVVLDRDACAFIHTLYTEFMQLIFDFKIKWLHQNLCINRGWIEDYNCAIEWLWDSINYRLLLYPQNQTPNMSGQNFPR